MTANAPVAQSKSTRTRASERSVSIALKAIRDAGLAVDKVCIAGGQIEIHCAAVEGDAPIKNHGGLKDW